jgi:hypothetical protein
LTTKKCLFSWLCKVNNSIFLSKESSLCNNTIYSALRQHNIFFDSQLFISTCQRTFVVSCYFSDSTTTFKSHYQFHFSLFRLPVSLTTFPDGC